MAPVARGLADSFRVLEPFQLRSAIEPLTVARHVADLHELVSRCGHYPWLERAVRDEFFSVVRQWLARQFTQGQPAVDV